MFSMVESDAAASEGPPSEPSKETPSGPSKTPSGFNETPSTPGEETSGPTGTPPGPNEKTLVHYKTQQGDLCTQRRSVIWI